MCLQPIYFISRSTVSPLENSRHIFVVKAASVRWYMENFRNNLWGAEFTVLSDFRGMKNFIESEANITHVVHR